MRLFAYLLVVALLVGCSGPTEQPQSSQPVVPTAVVAAISASATPAATASATALPATATAAPSATALPSTATAAPPTATPDPFAQYAPFTIEALRARSYGEGAIEITDTMGDNGQFTSYLFAYQSDGHRVTGYMNRPKGDGPFPVVILNHGYYPLDAYQPSNGTKRAADYLAANGFLTLAPDFRSHAGSDDVVNTFRAGHVIDTLNLIPLAQKLPEAQPGKVGMWGHSNGGAVTAKAIVISDQIAAAVIYSPASSNIEEDYQFRLGRSRARAGQAPGRRTGVIDRIEMEFPVTPEQAPDLYQRLSPLPYLNYVSMPVQIHWGTSDETVPYKWPGDLLDGLRAAGKQVEYFEYAGQPHSFQGAANQLYLERITAFYKSQLVGS